MIAVSKNIEKLWLLVTQDAIAAAMKADFFFLRKGIIINESLMSAFSNEAPFGLLEYYCSEIAALHLAKNSEGMNFDKLSTSAGKFWRIRHMDIFSGKNF